MGIISLTTDVAGQVGNLIGGVAPRRVAMVTTDSLSTVTTAGYLNNVQRELASAFYPTDVIECWYGYSSNASPGTFTNFTLSFSNGVITLVQNVNPGDVLLPVVSGDYAIFNGTAGQLKDSSQASTNASNPFVVSSPGSLTTNHIAQIADANGSIKDGGVLGTAASKAASAVGDATLASVSGATVTGNFLKAADTAGTIADGGAAIHAGVTAAFAGGGTTNTFTTTNMTASSIVTTVILTSTNSVAITKAVPGTNTLAVTFSADPGANTTLNWISITPAI